MGKKINSGDIVVGVDGEKVVVVIENGRYKVYDTSLDFIIDCEDYDDFYCFMDDSYCGIEEVSNNDEVEDILIAIEAIERMKKHNPKNNITLEELIKKQGFNMEEISKLEKEIEFE